MRRPTFDGPGGTGRCERVYLIKEGIELYLITSIVGAEIPNPNRTWMGCIKEFRRERYPQETNLVEVEEYLLWQGVLSGLAERKYFAHSNTPFLSIREENLEKILSILESIDWEDIKQKAKDHTKGDNS